MPLLGRMLPAPLSRQALLFGSPSLGIFQVLSHSRRLPNRWRVLDDGFAQEAPDVGTRRVWQRQRCLHLMQISGLGRPGLG